MKNLKDILNWEAVWAFSVLITKNKIFDIQLSKWKCWDFFNINFRWTHRQDHAGLELDIQIIGFELSLGIVDKRHWDDENNTWVK